VTFAIEHELAQATVEQGCSFGRSAALAVLRVAAEDRPVVLGCLEHPRLVLDLLAGLDPVVLGDRHDAEPGRSEPVGERDASEVPVDEEGR
jgi:hypothetical protein